MRSWRRARAIGAVDLVNDVTALTRADFAEHVKTYYTPSNSVLSVAGNTTHDEVMRLAEQHYGDMPDTPAPAPPPASARFPDERVIVEKREIAQCNIGIAMYGIARLDPDRYPLQIMNTILGRGMSSRLFREVREKRGLAYSVGSGASRYTDIGTMSVSAGVTLDHLEEATQVILDELFKLRDEPVADDELVKAQDFSTGNFRLGLESTMALAQRFDALDANRVAWLLAFLRSL